MLEVRPHILESQCVLVVSQSTHFTLPSNEVIASKKVAQPVNSRLNDPLFLGCAIIVPSSTLRNKGYLANVSEDARVNWPRPSATRVGVAVYH